MIKRKSFGFKLWLWFLLFSAVIFVLLWLLQTVFLQSFYNGMAIRAAQRAMREMELQFGSDGFYEAIDRQAGENSLLVFVTDAQGSILYGSDRYKELYSGRQQEPRNGNPYFESGDVMNWQKGALRYLPDSYDTLLSRLKESGEGSVGFVTPDGSAYVAGAWLDDGSLLYLSLPLGQVDGTVRILRIQLLWVSVLALILGFGIAWFISRRFGRPIADITNSAKLIASGDYHPKLPKGFCAELDELADTLQSTAESLELAGNAKREFLAGVSHDLRTPLTMIKGYAEMVNEISWSDEQKRKSDLEVIMREADRLTALVNEILEFSALKAGKFRFEYGVMDLSAAVKEVVAQFEPFFKQQGYLLQANISDGLYVNADPSQLKRVIYNFIDNAVNHTDDSKKITLSLSKSGDFVRLEVTDYGPGIPKKDLPYIWDRYYTARSRKNGAAVSGLGLSIAKEILIAHHADFGVDTQNHCTTFWLALHAGSSAAAALHAVRASNKH